MPTRRRIFGLEPADDQPREFGHVFRLHADARDFRRSQAKAVHVAGDRSERKADAAGEQVGPPEFLRRRLSAAVAHGFEGELMR